MTLQQALVFTHSFCRRRLLLLLPLVIIIMKCRIGLLGLPNVGKSSLFNALVQQSIAAAANFPFCTIDPNVAPIAKPDPYLQALGKDSVTQRAATMEWVDVAGLAPNAHLGEGLGNQFLGTLRTCHALCHVVRVFEDSSATSDAVHHVTGRVNPVQDVELINLELLLADLEHVQRRLDKLSSSLQRDDDATRTERDVLQRIHTVLEAGQPARTLSYTADERAAIQGMGLLTLKPVLYALNVDEVDFTLGRAQAVERIEREILPQLDINLNQHGSHDEHESTTATKDMYALVSAKLEADLYEKLSDPQERYEYLSNELGMDGDIGITSWQDLEQQLSYNVLPNKIKLMLNLSLVYTGPGVPPERSQTTKAYLFSPTREAWTAHDLAGRLHGDIQRGFIRAEVVSAPDLLSFDSWAAAKESGRIKTEGKQYRLEPNDVVLIKWR